MKEKKNFCPNCGNFLKDNEDLCRKCGKYTNNNMNDITNANHIQKSKSNKVGLIILIIIIAVVGVLSNFIFFMAILLSNSVSENGETKKNYEEKWKSYYEENNIEYTEVYQNVLYDYGKYYKGKTVLTAVKIDSIYSDSIKVSTSNNKSFQYSFIFKFDDENEIKRYNEDTTVVIIGEINSLSSKTINLKSCHIISSGNTAEVKNQELENNSNNQIEYAKSLEAAEQKKQEENKIAKKNEYISKCQTRDYNDILRNPNNYKGQYTTATGEVLQVSTGLFNSVTIRLNDSSNNTWYVTYEYSSDNEPRIIEGDNLTVYGKSDGTTSYRAVLGNQITLPSIKAKYVIIN